MEFNMKELILCLIFLASMALAFWLTKSKAQDKCQGCQDDCSQCQAFQHFYEDYQKDKQKER